MPEYIGINNVARNVSQQYVGVSSVARQVSNGYVGIGGVARLFFSSGVPPVTNFAKVSKEYNKINFSWTNPTSNYTGFLIRASTGSAPTTTTAGTQIYKGAGTNSAAGAKNTSGLVSLSITSNTSTTYYFTIWTYHTVNGTTTYSKVYQTTNAGLVCYNCSQCSNYCYDCDDCYNCSDCSQCDISSDCGCHGPGQCNDCNQSSGCPRDCGDCEDCNDCGDSGCDHSSYPNCGKQTY